MQTVVRSILCGAVLGTAALGTGLAAWALSSWLGVASTPWIATVVSCTLITVAGGVGYMALARAVFDLERGLQGDDVLAPRGPRWLRSIFKVIGAHQLRHRQELAAWRTRERDLEIRARVADQSQRRSQAVLEVMDEAVVVCNPFAEIVFVNDAAGALLDIDTQAAIGCGVADVVRDRTLRRIITETLEAGPDIDPRRSELTISGGSDDESTACEIVAACAMDHRGRPCAVVTVLHDLTREREIAQMKSEFVSKASHELRTPLSSMRAYVEMLVDGEAEDEATRREWYSVIQSETDRLARLVDNMLNISRIEAGIIEVDRGPTDMTAIVRSAMQMIDPQAREKSITMHAEIAPVDSTVLGDADMLQQVVVNLLSNGVKYTPDGGRITVTVDSDNLTRCVHVAVSDTGLGIPPVDAEHVFEKFFRVENYKRVAKGTGLGLNLCRHIIETVHRGQIGLESTLGMGSKFWFTVPMGTATARKAA